ncbi:hypothetical protein IM538_21815 [Cytobacillus suaedae]|nr:hypothetical protein IM538_21815 [Cytobacillus suaedae]
MKYIKSEKGYALIIVLITITVIMLVIPILVSSMLNSSKQFQTTEEDIQLTKLATMGVQYTEKAVEVSSEEAKQKTLAWIEEQRNLEPPVPEPSEGEKRTKFIEFFKAELRNNYFPGDEIVIPLQPNRFMYKVEISIDSSVQYTVFPSVDGQFLSGDSIDGDIAVNINFN